MASIRDVARIAGVSPSTVSRVINGTANVDEDKREKVLLAIHETGFKPNELARALFKKSSRIIGVIVPNIENPFFNELAKTVEEEAYRCGYKILLCNSNDNSDKEIMNIQMLNQIKADGIVIITNSDLTQKAIAESEIPVILMDRKVKGTDEIAFIESDHYAGGVMAAEHLIESGCRNIVCITGPQDLSSGRLRYEGYRDVCKEYGLEEQCVSSIYDYDAGLTAAGEILMKYPNADGIIACNDMVAIAVYKVLANNGLRVPEDVQIIGFDNVKFSHRMVPEFSTITQPINKMGTLAVQIITKYGCGLPFQRENIFDVSLVKRQTTTKKEG